jgi:hypothetical protein
MSKVINLLQRSVSLVALVFAASAVAHAEDCVPKRRIEIQLSTARPATGGTEISPGCWMPQVTGTDKEAAALCAHDIKGQHDFAFVLDNKCSVDVRLELTVDRGSVRLKRSQNGVPTSQDCGLGSKKELFGDYLPAGTAQRFTCANESHVKWAWKWTRRGSYGVRATHVRAADGTPVRLSPPVDYDPEIVIEDNGRGAYLPLFVGFVLLVLGWLAYRRFFSR